MKKLLIADLRRIFKGKGIYVLMILGFIFPAISALIVQLSGLANDVAELGDLAAEVFNPVALYAGSFNPTQNIGLILLIVVAVLISGEFTNNTIRNKIVAGHSKTSLFLSSLVTVLTYVFVVVLVNSSFTYLFNSISFGLQPFSDYFKRGLVAYSSIFVIYTIMTLLTYQFKNLAGPLGLVLGIYFVLMMISTIVFSFNGGTGFKAKVLFYIFPFLYLSGIATPIKLEWLWATLTNVGYLALLTTLGILLANRTDYK
ncbi:MAG: ABC-2 family transporter protein [Tenericutes bacterium ADurb.Bin024]|nr:MAG: ABC-2 family transporter protein [Tenericutes bacterium ADurb.Bin024]